MRIGRGGSTAVPSYRRSAPIRTWLIGVLSLAMVVSLAVVATAGTAQAVAPSDPGPAPALPALETPGVALVPLRAEPEADTPDRAKARARLAELFAASQQAEQDARAARARAQQPQPQQPALAPQQPVAAQATPRREGRHPEADQG